jgi:hypothetical protein
MLAESVRRNKNRLESAQLAENDLAAGETTL